MKDKEYEKILYVAFVVYVIGTVTFYLNQVGKLHYAFFGNVLNVVFYSIGALFVFGIAFFVAMVLLFIYQYIKEYVDEIREDIKKRPLNKKIKKAKKDLLDYDNNYLFFKELKQELKYYYHIVSQTTLEDTYIYIYATYKVFGIDEKEVCEQSNKYNKTGVLKPVIIVNFEEYEKWKFDNSIYD